MKRLVEAVVVIACAAGLAGPVTGGAGGADLTVTSVDPVNAFVTAPVHTDITVNFDRPVDPATVMPSSFHAFGRWSGAAPGTLTLSNGDQTVTLTPDRAFSAGEMVMVVLSHDLRGADGTFLRPGGYSFQFWTRARPSAMTLQSQGIMTTNGPGESSRPYGGIGSDLDGDGWLDITLVNEDTADLRVFMNDGAGSGVYEPFLAETFTVGFGSSPSEPADFNGDGFTDICVTNPPDGSVSILLGEGDGTFAPRQEVGVGANPRGIAVLDADGDGDPDIVTANAGSGNCTTLLNDGNGVFSSAGSWEAGVSNEWALVAADMNEDGLLDLVVGGQGSQTAAVNLGNGDGTFTFSDSTSIGGSIWMLAAGDVNGDGHQDVCGANSSGTGAILFGDGAGGLGFLATYPVDPFCLATDFGDGDGDGDLDWVTASFGGDWFVFENDGAGVFSFVQELPAPAAASCSLYLDIDNDGDLDLALVDEIADTLELMKNSGTTAPGDVNGDGVVDIVDLLDLLAAWGPCPPGAWCDADVDRDGSVAIVDLLMLLAGW